tara:strand:+ start:158 stop:760 length:603 start_codon:yes stop_codon:yes gene_type:complete
MYINNIKNDLEIKGHIINIHSSVEMVNCEILTYGQNNTLIIDEGVKLYNVKFRFEGSDSILHIKSNTRIHQNALLWLEYNTSIIIGNNTRIEGLHIASLEGKKVIIGNDCLFAHDIEMRTGDSHFIYEKGTHDRINNPSDIIIGNHVWVCAYSKIMKGVNIKDDCVIGSSSLVNKSFEESNVIIAGTPAKIIKRNIEWSR